MGDSYYSDEDGFPSLSPSQENSSYYSKGKKKKRPIKRSNNKKKNSASTNDTNYFLKDINHILSDKNVTDVLQNPKSARMSLSINRNVDQANILQHQNSNISSNGSDPNRGNMRHSILSKNTVPALQAQTAHKSDGGVSSISNQNNVNDSRPAANGRSTFTSQRSSLGVGQESEEDDFDPALKIPEKFNRGLLSRDQSLASDTDSGRGRAPMDRRTSASAYSERLQSSAGAQGFQYDNVQPAGRASSNTDRKSSAMTPQKLVSIPGNKPHSVTRAASAPIAVNSNAAVLRQPVRQGSVASQRKPSGIPSTRAASFDARLRVRDVYSSSSSSDRDSEYYDSSEGGGKAGRESDSGTSEDFDIQQLAADSSLLEEGSVVSEDPKIEESKADPLLYDMLMLGDGGVGKTAILNNFITDSFSSEYVSTRGINQHHSTLYMGQRKMLDRGKLRKRHVHVRLNIWDIGGRLKKHAYIKNSYILNSIIVLVVYDITSLESYLNALETIRHVREVKYDQMVVLVGNKADNSTIAADDDDFASDEDESNIVVQPPPPTGLRRFSMMRSRRSSAITGRDRRQVQPANYSDDDDDDDDGRGQGHGPRQPILREIAKKEAALEALRLGALFFETSAKTGHNIYVLFNEISKILVHKRRKLLFKIEAGIKSMKEENDEHSSDYESSDDSGASDPEREEGEQEGKSQEMDEEARKEASRKRRELRKKRKEEDEEESSDDDSVLSAMSDWSDEDDDFDDDYVDMYGWGGKKKKEKADCVVM